MTARNARKLGAAVIIAAHLLSGRRGDRPSPTQPAARREIMDQAVKFKSVIKSKFISHGTLGSKDLEKTRRFYEEFLGLEVVRTSPVSMMVRLGSHHVYAVVQSRSYPAMDHLNHNGIDVESDADVNEAHRLCTELAEIWGIKKITKPRTTHGTYCF